MKTSEACCATCGQPAGECYLICPEMDPHGGDQASEEADYSFGAEYDRWDGYRGEGDDQGFEADFEAREMEEAEPAAPLAPPATPATIWGDDDIPF